MPRFKVLITPLALLLLLGGFVPWWITKGLCPAGGTAGLTAFPGVILVLAGVALVLRAALLLADAREDVPPSSFPGRFVVRGPYRRVRNPLYAGIFLVALGEAIALLSPALFLYAAGLAIFLHLIVVLVEEPKLRKRFGDLYDVYCERVPRWLPGRGNSNAP